MRFGLLPAVYYPSYRLNYFRIEKENGHLVIDYVEIPKTPERELTWLQWLSDVRKGAQIKPSHTAEDGRYFMTPRSQQARNSDYLNCAA